MKSEFLTELKTELRGERIHILLSDLIYNSELLSMTITVPAGFNTDLASVPRVPIVYGLWGDRAHREAVIHDYLYRIYAVPEISRELADKVFLEAMESRAVAGWIRYPMYMGVRMGGGCGYHQRFVTAELLSCR